MTDLRYAQGAIKFPTGATAPILRGTGARVAATATAASTSQAAIPGGGVPGVLLVRANAHVWLRFGTAGMGAAAADANSILFLAGEAIVVVLDTATHFRVMRVGADNVPVQLESVA